jgi:protein involved in polysaccharide export with SLBB domain
MKKFFFAAAVALAFCCPCARAGVFQSDGVRVGPAAEEKAAAAADAPAPKKDDKARAGGDAKGERKEDASKKPAERREGDRAEGERVSEQPQNPAALSTASATTAATGAPSSTSDAPPKPAAPAPVANVTPANSSATDTKGADASRSPSTAAPANNTSAGTNNASTNNSGANTAGTTAGASPSPAGTSPSVAKPTATPASANPSALVPAAPLTNVYRVGIGDVLDIRLLNDKDPRQSTLYTVLAGGALEYPLLHDPVTVAGMTTEELAAQLIAELRHRGIFQHPQVRVSVREYASHTVLVSGLVGDPGTKILQREAIPLYVVVAEAQPKPEAGRAVVVSHATGKMMNVDLADSAGMNTLVQPGDVINLVVRPPEFFYAGGEIGSPGQKDFHSGMTLTQALLAAGGVTPLAGAKVRVSRAGADGRLVSTEYDLQAIEGGAVPDPLLQAGDRIEVPRAGKARK